jgi:AraC-like DNA-binding protein
MEGTMGQSTDTLIRPAADRYITEPVSGGQTLTTRPPGPFPLPHGFVPGEDGQADRSREPTPLVGIVMKLLDRAAEAVDTDPEAAKDCISRAAALLQSGRSKADYESRGKTPAFIRGGLTPWQARQVTRHIESALGSSIGTEECAAIAKLSSSHFRRAFKASFGETFSAYLSRRRVERAQEMMVTTDQPLCLIARQCGFADQSHFTRVFRRLVGPSPGSWRRL